MRVVAVSPTRMPRVRSVARSKAVCAAAATAAAAVLLQPRAAQAVDYLWQNGAGGTFQTTTNWSGGAAGTFPDDNTDKAIFDLGSGGYVVSLSAAVTNNTARVRRDVVTMNLGGFTYTLTATGAGAAASLTLGDAADQSGTLTLTNGTVSGVTAAVAASTNTFGILNVTTGASLNLSGTTSTIGSIGNGTLTISGGGHFTHAGLALAGGNASGSGSVTVTGAGSTLVGGAGAYAIGSLGTGSVSVLSGGAASGGAVTVATSGGSNGSMLVSGTGSTWSMSTLTVGASGFGTLGVAAGGAATATGNVTLGSALGGSGTASVSGAGSSFSTTGSMTIANAGDASFTVDSGATLSNAAATLGNTSGGTGQLQVAGAGTTWTNTGAVTVGQAGTGSVSVDGGAHVTSTLLSIAAGTTGAGSVDLADAGTNWTANNNITVGGNGATAGGEGSLTIEPGATLAQTGAASIFRVHPMGTVNLNGGTLSVISLVNSGGTFNFNSGTLNVAAAGPALSVSPTGALGATVSLDSSQAINVTNSADVAVGGLLLLNGGTFSAGTLSNLGEVHLTADAATIGGGTLSNTGLVLGDGRITANLTNNSGGEVRVASPADRLVFKGATNTNAGQVNILGGGTVEFTNGLTNNNQVNMTGGLLTSAGAIHNNPAGRIAGRGTIIAASLVNDGQASFSGGLSDVFAPVTGTTGSTILVTGGSTTTFYNPVTNNSGATITVAAGSSIVFLGGMSGAGALGGAGTKYFADGSSNPATLQSTGATVVEAPATVTTANVRENALTVLGQLSIKPNGTSAGTSSVNTLTVSGAGKFDLANNNLVVKSSTLAAVQAAIALGFNGGQWNGPGVNSSAAASDSRHLTTLGYASNGALGANSFSGITGLDADDVLVKYTYYGDADLNGKVTLDDFTQFLSGYQGNGSTWLLGDFDYNGKVTLDDFTLFLNAYQNQGAPLSAIGDAITEDHTLTSADRAMMFAAIAAVPEPGSISLIAVATCIAMSTRRQRRRQTI